MNNQCIKCGGEMIGDGYTSVIHCEYAKEPTYEFHEPDASPVYCDFKEIIIGKKWDANAQYIGRGSPLGNPFVMKSEADREHVCTMYQQWFDARVAEENPKVMNELRRLYKLAKQGNLILGCFCSPKQCHGETIKQFLETHLSGESS